MNPTQKRDAELAAMATPEGRMIRIAALKAEVERLRGLLAIPDAEAGWLQIERDEARAEADRLREQRDEAQAMLARVRRWAEDTSTHMDECFGRGYSKARESIRMMINKVRG